MEEERKSENGGSDIEMNGNEKLEKGNDFLNPFNEVENMNGAASTSKLESF